MVVAISNGCHMKFKPRFAGYVSYLSAAGLFLALISYCRLASGQQEVPNRDSIGQRESFKKGLNALKENRLEEALAELTAAEGEDRG